MEFDTKGKFSTSKDLKSRFSILGAKDVKGGYGYNSEIQNYDEGLTEYFEELAAKALELTKKYGLKDEFEMIQHELKKNNEIKLQFAEQEDLYRADPDMDIGSSGEDQDSFEDQIITQLPSSNLPQSHRVSTKKSQKRVVLK